MDAETSPSTSLRDFLHVIFKRKFQILLFFGITVCTVAIGSFVVRPTYEATAQILIKIGRENIYVPTLPAGGTSNPVISFNREEQINSEIEILKSRFLAEKVAESLGPAVIYKDLDRTGHGFLGGLFQTADARESPLHRAVIRLRKNIEVEGVRKSDVINVSFTHKDPDMAATVVNSLISVYLDRHLSVHKSPQSFGFFQEQSQILESKLKQAEENLEAFKKEHNLTSLEEERTLVLGKTADLRAALNQTLSQEAETGNRLRQLRHQVATTPKTVPLDEEVDHNPLVISNLQARLVELELKEHELLTKYTDQSRLVQSVRAEIQMVRQKLAVQETRRYGKTRSGVNTVYQALQAELFRNEAELKALRAKKDTQSAHLADYRKKLEKLNRLEVEFNRLQQAVEVDRQNYRLYLTKFEESRISNAMDTEKIANVSLIEPARPPLKPVSPRIFLNLVIATFLGGVGAFGLAFFSEYVDDSLEKNEDVEDHLGLPVLASIPQMER